MLKTIGFPTIRTGNQTIIGGNLVIGTAGNGIDFSADPSAPGMTSELLDDYEEGTWTPVLSDATTGGNTSPTAATSAIYTKVGRLVTVQGFFANINTTGMTGGNDMFIQGLPFTAASVAGTTFVPGSIILADVTFTGYVVPHVSDNTTVITMRESASGAGSDGLMVSEFATGAADIYFNLTYQAA